ncbi:hypothetical protein [Nocardia sp. NPDC046763]|uniref:hypothetical protein n=1 Tax=Nocardia sp. NPDC046763 TaxID=3155256 RepID=UPI0033C2FCBD
MSEPKWWAASKEGIKSVGRKFTGRGANAWLAVLSATFVSIAAVGYLTELDQAPTVAFALFGTGLGFAAAVVHRVEGEQKFSAQMFQLTLAQLSSRREGEGEESKPVPVSVEVERSGTGEGQLSVEVEVVAPNRPEIALLDGPASRQVIAQLADAAARYIAFRDPLSTPEYRVTRADEAFQLVYSMMRSGSPLPGGPVLLTSSQPTSQIMNDGVVITNLARQVTTGALSVTHEQADDFVNAVSDSLAAIRQVFSEPVSDSQR